MYASTLPRSNWLWRASIRLAWYRHMPASSWNMQWWDLLTIEHNFYQANTCLTVRNVWEKKHGIEVSLLRSIPQCFLSVSYIPQFSIIILLSKTGCSSILVSKLTPSSCLFLQILQSLPQTDSMEFWHPVNGGLWQLKHWRVRQINPAQLVFGRTEVVWYLLHKPGSRHCHLAIGHCTIRQRAFDCNV